MKKLLTICLLLLSIVTFAQTKMHKLDVSVSWGSQKYSGDLGNGFTFKNTCWCGGGGINIGYRLNKSFDVGIFGFMGDMTYHQPENIAKQEVEENERCGGCTDRVGLGNLNCRMTSGGALIKYKFSNNYLLKENSILRPYIYLGGAVNEVKDFMKMNCVNSGNYFSLNAGAGVRCYLGSRVSIGYNLAFGYFTSDNIDFMSHGGSNDMYMQNTISLGIDLF